jgi:hypothetical protein
VSNLACISSTEGSGHIESFLKFTFNNILKKSCQQKLSLSLGEGRPYNICHDGTKLYGEKYKINVG